MKLFAVCAPAGFNNLKVFKDLVNYTVCIISSAIIPFIFSLAFVMFLWGMTQFLMNSEEEAKREKGRQFMIWGIIALTVMVSVWGLVKVLGGTFNVPYVIPKVQNTV